MIASKPAQEPAFVEPRPLRRCNHTHGAALLFWALTRALFSTTVAAQEMPPIYTADWPQIRSEYPTWVSESAAFLPNGEPDPSLFSPNRLEFLSATLAIPEDPDTGCIGTPYRYDFSWRHPPSATTAEAAIRRSEQVIFGQVVSKETGFSVGEPGQLFALAPYGDVGRNANLGRYYFFVPSGRFRVGPYTICHSDSHFPLVEIDVGDQALILKHKLDSESGMFINVAGKARLAVIKPDGTVHTGDEFLHHELDRIPLPAMSGSELRETLTRLVPGEGGVR